ncbi:polysaccharide biosynthesis protein, partial [Parabacteroides distasonis]|nr:polysaccharide biosynthesis protein [Parabacteroides distasonis]
MFLLLGLTCRSFHWILLETVVSDICVRERMEELFEEHRPDYVFHAAA